LVGVLTVLNQSLGDASALVLRLDVAPFGVWTSFSSRMVGGTIPAVVFVKVGVFNGANSSCKLMNFHGKRVIYRIIEFICTFVDTMNLQ
jgi:hypothetical protein